MNDMPKLKDLLVECTNAAYDCGLADGKGCNGADHIPLANKIEVARRRLLEFAGSPVPEGRLTAEEIALIGDAIWSTNNDDPDKPRAQVILNGLSMNDGEGRK